MIEFDWRQIQPGTQAVVIQIPDHHTLKRRLQAFGCTVGSVVTCRFLSPGRDLAALELLGSVLAVRVADLHGIIARRCA